MTARTTWVTPTCNKACYQHLDTVRSTREHKTQRVPQRIIVIIRTFTNASIWCSKIALLQKGTRGFGRDSVKGRRRVPKPPARVKHNKSVQNNEACMPMRLAGRARSHVNTAIVHFGRDGATATELTNEDQSFHRHFRQRVLIQWTLEYVTNKIMQENGGRRIKRHDKMRKLTRAVPRCALAPAVDRSDSTYRPQWLASTHARLSCDVAQPVRMKQLPASARAASLRLARCAVPGGQGMMLSCSARVQYPFWGMLYRHLSTPAAGT